MWQGQEPCTALSEHFGCFGTVVNAEIVEDDDIAALQLRCELGFDVRVEGNTVDRAVDDPGSHETVAAQAGDERLCCPAAERGLAFQAFAAWRPATQARQIGGNGGFVDEDQALRRKPHERLTLLDPHAPLLGHIRTVALAGQQDFFYM